VDKLVDSHFLSELLQVTASAIHTSWEALEQDSGVSRVVNGKDLAIGGFESVSVSYTS
jgi:hypothetical protein